MLQEMQLRNYSSRTIQSYLSSLIGLAKHYKKSPAEITTAELKTYLHYCITERKASVSFVNQTISALKILHVNVLGKHWDDMLIKRPRREKKLPVILSHQEANAVIQATKNIKHKAILMMGYSSGLRIGEVINLRISDIDSKRMQVRVYLGKGKKDRYTLLSPTALDLLRIYYKACRPNHWLFEGWEIKQYSQTSIGKILKRSCQKAGINKAVTFHSLRHCFATHLLEQGVSLQIIQQLLGHSSIRTTSVYLHVQQYSIDKVVSPIDFKQ
ncbi:site-specific integrase [bacterium AH-315-C07]|nr:site-specific integrase [bacterium AH-315-C07]